MSHALGTAAPVGDLGFVDLIPVVVFRRQTRGIANCAVDIDQTAADSTDQMVVVVANAILEASGRPWRLNAPDEAFGHQQTQCVIHRLKRDGADLDSDDLGHAVGRDVGLTCDGS